MLCERGRVGHLHRRRRSCARGGRSRGWCLLDVAGLDQLVDDLLCGFLDAELVRAQFDLRAGRRLVGVVDSGKALGLAGARLGVETLDVALFADLERGVCVHLDEVLGHHARLFSDRAIRRNRGRNHERAVALKEMGHERDTTNVRVAVLLAETETFGKVLAHDVTVKQLDRHVCIGQLLLENVSDRGLSRTRKPSEPDHYTAVSIDLLHTNPFQGVVGCFVLLKTWRRRYFLKTDVPSAPGAGCNPKMSRIVEWTSHRCSPSLVPVACQEALLRMKIPFSAGLASSGPV